LEVVKMDVLAAWVVLLYDKAVLLDIEEQEVVP
jgi:hypothetical protein